MKRSVIAFVSLALLAGFAQGAQSQTPKIGVVNVNGLLQNSPQYRTALEALQTEFGPEEREITTLGTTLKTREDKLTKDAATMSEAQRAAAQRELRDGYIDLQAKQEKVQDKLNARRNEELTKLQRLVLEEVQKYAQANGYDLILADGVLYAGQAMDVTAPVLAALQAKRPGAAAPAPAKPATP